MDLDDLITPALLIDKKKLLRNIQRMTEKAQRNRVHLRPHVKTHKCIEIGNLQIESGASGITVSTLGEAKAFIAAGFSDITLAYPIIPDKLPELMNLANGINLKVLVDHPSMVTALEAQCIAADIELYVLIKVDCGYHRCGVDPVRPESIKLAKQIMDAPHLVFSGILTHAGHAYQAKSRAELQAIAESEQDVMLQFTERLETAGLAPQTVSIGSTPTAMITDSFKAGITEIRPGNYVFFDNSQVLLGSCQLSDCALSVLTSVVSVQSKHIVVDAGATTLSKDTGPTHISPKQGYGIVLSPEENIPLEKAHIVSISQEHGKIRFSQPLSYKTYSPGDRICIIPNHSCLVANLFDHYNVVENNQVTANWTIERHRFPKTITNSWN